jgi:phage tail-like protein
MTRAATPELPSRFPIGELLPGLYADDDFAQRFTSGLDMLIAPVLSTVDNLAAYFDPRLAPADFVFWLASWVGIQLDAAWAPELRREVLARAVELHRWRGTTRGLVERLRLCLGVHAEIVDGGGVTWSTSPDTALPGAPSPGLLVRVWPWRSSRIDRAQVAALVAASCPVQLTSTVEIVPGPPDRQGR